MKTIKEAVTEVYQESGKLLGEKVVEQINAKTGLNISHLWLGYMQHHKAVCENSDGGLRPVSLDIKIHVRFTGEITAKVTSHDDLIKEPVDIVFTSEMCKLYENVSYGAMAWANLTKEEQVPLRSMNMDNK